MKQKTNKLAQFKQWILSIVMPRFICFFKGHKPVKMLIEDEMCIHTRGCERCKQPLGLPTTWKFTPCPTWNNEDDWQKFKEQQCAEIRASVNGT